MAADPSEMSAANSQSAKTVPPFKSQEWLSSRYSNHKKSKVWKSLKQILSSEKTSVANSVSYASLDCGPSKRPAKKYSDLSGLPAKYKDPSTQLLYHDLEEFALIKTFSNDIVNGYLELRKASLWFTFYTLFLFKFNPILSAIQLKW